MAVINLGKVKGVQGDKGEKGDKGDTGETGERGPQGVQGIQGSKGETGDRGDTGLINGATQVQVDSTTKVMYNGSSIPANTAASKLVGTASGQIPLAQDLTKALYTPLQLAGALLNVTDSLNDKIEGNVYYINDSPQGASGFGYGVFWTEKPHNSARRLQYFKSVVSMTGHYVRQETVRDSQTYNNWVKYAFHGEDYTATSVKSGAASYKRGWRKLTASFGSGASTINRAHGVSNIAGVTVRATVSGVSYYANDARATHQFTIQTDGTNVIITKSVDATALNGAALTIYIDEEL